MINYCFNCGKKRDETDLFCTNCGTKFEETIQNENIPVKEENINSFEKQIAYASKETGVTENIIYIPPTNSTIPQNHITKKSSKKKKILFPVITIAIVVLLISSGLLIVFNTEDNNSSRNIASTFVRENGPKVSLSSLSGGSISSIPKEGYSATYGLYDESGIFGIPGLRIGEIVEENLGEKNFQGEECILIKINGEISIPMKRIIESYAQVSSGLSGGSSNLEMLEMFPDELPFSIYSEYYVNKDDYSPVYMEYKIDFTELMQLIIEFSEKAGYDDELNIGSIDGPVIIGYIINWNRDESKADMSFCMEGIPFMNMDGDFTIEFSEEYWGIEPEMEELYVGFEKIIEFTSTIEVNNLNFNLDYEIEELKPIEMEEMYIEKEYDNYYEDSFIQDREYEYEEILIREAPDYYYDDIYTEEDYEYDITEIFEDDYSLTTSTTMEIKVVDKEEVEVPAGIFKDCFVIEVNQKENDDYGYDDYGYGISSSSSTSSVKIWVNENGVMPKAEYSLLGSAGLGMYSDEFKFVIKLENYTN